MQETIQVLTSQLRQQNVTCFNMLFKGVVVGDPNCTMDIYKSGFGDLAFFDNATILTAPEAAMMKMGNVECSDSYIKLKWSEPQLHLTARDTDCMNELVDYMAVNKPDIRVWPLGIYLAVVDLDDQKVNVRQIWWCMYGSAVSIPVDVVLGVIADRKNVKTKLKQQNITSNHESQTAN